GGKLFGSLRPSAISAVKFEELSMKSARIRPLVILGIGLIGVLGYHRVSQVLRDRPFGAQAHAADDDSEAVKALIDALKDQDPEVRKNSALSLGRIGKDAKSAVQALVKTLKDSDVDVRGASAVALGRIGRDAAGATTAL